MNSYLARIKIMLHKEILDVQGKAVEKALHSLQFQQVNNVRIGKYVELEISAKTAEEAQAQVEDACEKLIANPIIEQYEVRIDKK